MWRLNKIIYCGIIIVAIFIAFVYGLNIGWATQSKQTIHIPPVIITPKPHIIYPVPTKEV